jgi:hypothetical protein
LEIAMDNAERRRIIDEAHSTLDRLNGMRPAERPRIEHEEDALAKYKREADETAARRAAARAELEAGTDAEHAAAWQAHIQQQVDAAAARVQQFVGNVVSEVIANERTELAEALRRRDQKIERLEVELVKAQAELAKLSARVIQGEVDRDRERRSFDASMLPTRQLN